MLRSLLTAKPLNLDLGLLIARVGIGLSMLVFHGWGKMTGGPEKWEALGGSMATLGLDFATVFWGFLAMFAEVFGSALLALGIFFRPAAGMLAGTMVIAVVMHMSLPEVHPGYGWSKASHALELLAIYIALLCTGPGKYRVALPLGGEKSS